MPHFHRNDNAGQIATSMTNPHGVPIQVTFDNLGADLTALRNAGAHHAIVDQAVTSIGQSAQQRAVHAIRIGKRQGNRDVLVAGCHHAREWISVEVPYLLAHYLVTNYGNVNRVTQIVDRLSVWVVPMVNPDGHEYSVTGKRLWRKTKPNAGINEVGSVDPNRNYNAPGWGTVTWSCRTDPNSDTYIGPHAASSVEVQNVQNLFGRQGVNFTGSLDFHSHCQYALHPWGYRHDQPHAPSQALANTFANAMAINDRYAVVQAALLYNTLFPTISPDNSRVPGGLYDFAANANVPAVTVELDPSVHDVRSFMLGEADIQPQFDKVRDAILTFLEAV